MEIISNLLVVIFSLVLPQNNDRMKETVLDRVGLNKASNY